MTSIIPEKDVEIIKAKLAEELKKEVKITLFAEPDATLAMPGRPPTMNKEAQQLIEELVALNDKLKLKVVDPGQDPDVARDYGIDKVPAVVIESDSHHNMRFFGFPGGFEFATMLQAIFMASVGKSSLAANTRLELAKIDQDIHLQVFTTPTWPHCPRVASLALAMAFENSHITADVVEATEFPHLAAKYQVSAVPMVVLSDTFMFVGAVPEESFLDAVTQTYNKLRAPSLEIPRSGGLEIPGQQKNEPPAGGSSGLIISK